jgi:hypothetical protein
MDEFDIKNYLIDNLKITLEQEDEIGFGNKKRITVRLEIDNEFIDSDFIIIEPGTE